MGKIKVDLHPVFNRTDLIEAEIADAIEKGLEYKIKEIEIIHGKGSGQLKKKIQRLLQKKYKQDIKRIDHDSKNHGRMFIYLNV